MKCDIKRSEIAIEGQFNFGESLGGTCENVKREILIVKGVVKSILRLLKIWYYLAPVV